MARAETNGFNGEAGIDVARLYRQRAMVSVNVRAPSRAEPETMAQIDSGALQDAVEWLIDGARDVRLPQDVMAGLGARLLAAGLPLHRVALFVRTLHPDVMGRRFLWRPGAAVEITEGSYDFLTTDTYRRNPVQPVMETGRTIRRRLEDPDCPRDFLILEELRAEGITDYLIQPLDFSDGQTHAISWTTIRPGGFSPADLAALEAIRRPLARLTEAYALRRVLTTLLSTYVGRRPGELILAGRIRRGDIERIHAVILLADLRGFTSLSDSLPGDRVIELLNGWFDALVPAIEAAGGEVLKFIGDGVLAIFPVGADPAAACSAALAAVATARSALGERNAALRARGEAELRYGMALHRGEVLYGNIGSSARLDFTTIGPAVNLAARLETLARDLGRELLVSAAVAGHCPEGLVALGRFELRGFREPQEVFAPADG
jgi:adenylate cyclase